MRVEQIIAAARAQTDEIDMRSTSFLDGLALIVSEMDHLEALPEAGRKRLESSCISFVVNQMKLSAYVKAHPEVMEQKIERPVFIFGMPRTGTTLVNSLLMQDKNRRTLLNWEAMDPVPPAVSGALFTDPRIGERQRLRELGVQSFPGLNKIHLENADGPTECLSIFKQEFKALYWDAQIPMRRYADFILACDMVPTYRFHKLVLQILQSTNPGVWQLKMPSHALFLDALLTVYPDARLVWTHRDPFKALGSLCSLIETVSGTNISPVDLDFMRWNYPRQAAEHLNRPLKLREMLGRESIFDVYYSEMLRAPLDVMKRLYLYLGDAFTDETEAAMRAWLEANPQGHFGRHTYGLNQYGIEPSEVAPLFERYLSQYPVEREG